MWASHVTLLITLLISTNEFNPVLTNSNSRFCSMRNCHPNFSFSLHSILRLIADSRFTGLLRLSTNMLFTSFSLKIFSFQHLFAFFSLYCTKFSFLSDFLYIASFRDPASLFCQFMCVWINSQKCLFLLYYVWKKLPNRRKYINWMKKEM